MTSNPSNRKRRLAKASRLINLAAAAAAAAAAATLAVGPTPAHAIHAECQDNDDYRTAKDVQCSQHVMCEGDGVKRAYGYDDVDILMLKYNCPETCGLCKDTPQKSSTGGGATDKNALGGTIRGGGGGLRVNSNNYGDGTNMRESNLNRRPGLRPPPSSESTYNRYTITDGHQELTQSCHAGWHPYCQDDEYYYSKLGLPCWFHVTQTEDCSVWLGAGYTREDVFELTTYCPCSCGVQCGTATMAPTSAPTEMPSPSPSAFPTISAAPTARPSPSPSSEPSSSPSASPTTNPSSGPSFTPSSVPTAHPSSHPSASPSHSPTSSPTPKPSNGPTWSPTDPPTKAPTRAPTRMPTGMPTRQPTSSPTRIAPVPAQGQARVRLPPTARPSVPVAKEGAGDEAMFDLLRQNNGNQEGEMECPLAITGLIPATPDCKFAIHCSGGTKTFGPIPCPNDGVFDIRSQNCVEPTRNFVCSWKIFRPNGGVGNVNSSAAATEPPRKTPEPTLAPITSTPTASPSRSPITATPTSSPVSHSPTTAPTALQNEMLEPIASHSGKGEEESLVSLEPFVEDVVDISEEEKVIARTSFVSGNVDDEIDISSEAPAEQSFWKTGLNPSTGKVFTLQVVAIAAVAGVLIIVLAVAMFSLGRRMNKNSKGKKNGAQTNIKPGDKVLIHNIPSIDDDIGDEENGFLAEFLKTFRSKDDDSTIQTRPSMKSTRSGNSMLKNSHSPPPRPANQTLKTIQAAQQLSKEVTEKQLKPAIKAAVQQVEVAASNSRESLQDATVKTAQDFNQCGDRMFQCASQMLCLPNDVNATCGSRRNLESGSRRRERGSDRSRSSRSRSSRSSGRRRRHRSSSRRHNREYSEGSTYEDV